MDPVAIALELLELPELPRSVEELNNRVASRIWRTDVEPLPWDDSRRRAWLFLKDRIRSERARQKRIKASPAA